MTELKTSALAWKRVTRIASGGVAVGLLVAAGAYYVSGGGLLLNASGMVMRDRVMISAPHEGRVKEMLVRPGDPVRAGQIIAKVESTSIIRSMAELSAERAKLDSKLAQLKGRKSVVAMLTPTAEASAKQTKSFLDQVTKAGASGMVVNKSLHDMALASLSASERYMSLVAERSSLETELAAIESSGNEIRTAYERLQSIYADGVLRSPVDGHIGNTTAAVGEVLGQGSTRLATVYTGGSYALAYLPESYLLELEEGKTVLVKARGRNVEARIDRILPMTDALPPEFQAPNKVRDRGQVVRVDLSDEGSFPTEQKVNVSTCYLTGCRHSLDARALEYAKSTLPAWKDKVIDSLPMLASRATQWASGAVVQAEKATAHARQSLTRIFNALDNKAEALERRSSVERPHQNLFYGFGLRRPA